MQSDIIKVLQEASSALVGTFELELLLQKIVESCRMISKASACSIFLVDEVKNRLVMRAEIGHKDDLRGIATCDISVNSDTPRIGLTAWIALTKRKFSAKTRKELISHPAWSGKFEELVYPGNKKCESFIGIPLIVRDKVIGVLKAENKIPDEKHPELYFTPAEEQSFEILANIVAIVIENVKLIELQGKQQAARLVNLYRIGTMLQEQEDIDRLLYIFLTGLTHGKGIGFNRAMYFEYKPITKQLIGQMAVGPLNKEEGERICRKIAGCSFTIEDSIRAFDEGKRALDTELNRLISKTVIDLERNALCVELASKRKKAFDKYELSSFSPNLKGFLERIETDKVILIGLAPSKERYEFVFCDNVYDQRSFDQNTKELLAVFIEQMSRALERIQSTDKVSAARESAWQEVSAMAAHRLGNILPFTENRLSDALKACSDSNLQSLLESCQEDIKIAINVLSDFKNFAAAGKINLPCLDNVNSTLKQIDELLKPDFKDIEIQTDYLEQGVIPSIWVDFETIKLVFVNLLVNTKDAKPKNPKVKIWAGFPSDIELTACGLRSKGNFIKIVYEDNGPGIPDEDKEKVFEAFFTRKPRSSGLGLAIVRKIIEQHGGKIFEDGRYNHGVRFNIVLPSVVI
ncbi:MAG: GAF domain-containing sensor histidine kinase [bacterium]|nr:GAF domain-containing sensor histidine kinase [bacterium]